MNKTNVRQSTKPKSRTDMGIYIEDIKKGFLLNEGEEDLKLIKLQSLSPKLKFNVPVPLANTSETLSQLSQSPENLSESEDEQKNIEKIETKIERIKKTTCQTKFQVFKDKGDPLSPLIKYGEKKAQHSLDKNQISFRNLVFNPNCKKSVVDKHLEKVHQSLVYALNHLKKPDNQCLHTKFVCLGEQKNKQKTKTLFLDLDETLIHSCLLSENPQYVVEGDIFQGESAFGFNIRPYCLDFLKIIHKFYEVYIFTASSDTYANMIIDILDPQNKYIRGILFRNHCLQTKKGIFIKDLRIVKNRSLKNMVIVDNHAHAFALQLENGIPIIEWKGDRSDQELKFLMHYLIELSNDDDVRTSNKKNLKLEEFSKVNIKEYLTNN